jgi:D-tagatose-1,6-bisphosphate aldolase subunit GatZ/KbaZ
MTDVLARLPARWRQDRGFGLASICSAHPLVLEAALAGDWTVLIEATCNQVNQEGGYTGMTPAAFRRFVADIARGAGFPLERVILGGDHLGPNPWKHLDAEAAMARAERMVADYIRAGFAKIHLDASMGCAGEPAALDDALVATRAARLARAAEAAAREVGMSPRYVVGTEVPVPGGASHAIAAIDVTRPAAVRDTIAAHARAFAAAGVDDAFARVVAVVVQPGVEFDHERVFAYEPENARDLVAVLDGAPDIVFEAHSTDYQPPAALAVLVRDGFAILKVGPGLTFAMREALYGLERIAAEIGLDAPPLEAAMESVMTAEPRYWAGYYQGPPETQRLLRHYGYSDRIRYYWPTETASTAVARLVAAFDHAGPIPETLVSQFIPAAYPAVRERAIEARPRALVVAAIRAALAPYRSPTGEGRA